MPINVLKTLPELEQIREEWNNLLVNSASHVPFLRHEYLVPWWQTLGGGEWSHGDLHILTDRSADGALQGIAPLFHTTNRDGKPALMFIGSIEISDYLDLFCAPGYLEAFIDAALDSLADPAVPEWQVLDLYNILEDSPTLPILARAARERGWTYIQERIQPAPSITLPGSWEDYLAGIQKKQRHEIRRKLRRAESYILPVRWYIVEDEASLDAEIEDFLTLMAYDHHKQEFLTEVMRYHLKEFIHVAFKAGWLQLAFLQIGSEKAAGYLNFDYMNHIWVYNSGIDFRFNELSPGWVLLAYLVQWAIENGRQVLDFMRGDEDYKYRFGGVDRHVVRVQVNR
jgi:CelD/BcsL family acetyltransferase involved in cellulose biosynthesis